jgi:hypothetical protein
MKAFAIAILPLVLGFHAAHAANYPAEVQGVWAGSRGAECRDTQCVCNSYLKDPSKTDGDIFVFKKNKREFFGGEGESETSNISVKKIGRLRWRITERYYEHGDYPGRPAWRPDVYEATIKDGLLVIKNKDGDIHRWMRCSPQLSGPPGKKPQD